MSSRAVEIDYRLQNLICPLILFKLNITHCNETRQFVMVPVDSQEGLHITLEPPWGGLIYTGHPGHPQMPSMTPNTPPLSFPLFLAVTHVDEMFFNT